MGFFDGFKTKKKNELEVSEVDKEIVKKGIKEYEKFYKEYEDKVKHSEDEYRVEYYVEARKEESYISERVMCNLVIKCEELGIDTAECLLFRDVSLVKSEIIVKDLEEVFNKTDKEIERKVIEVVKGILGERSDEQKLEDLIKAINYKKGVVFIKK